MNHELKKREKLSWESILIQFDDFKSIFDRHDSALCFGTICKIDQNENLHWFETPMSRIDCSYRLSSSNSSSKWFPKIVATLHTQIFAPQTGAHTHTHTRTHTHTHTYTHTHTHAQRSQLGGLLCFACVALRCFASVLLCLAFAFLCFAFAIAVVVSAIVVVTAVAVVVVTAVNALLFSTKCTRSNAAQSKSKSKTNHKQSKA